MEKITNDIEVIEVVEEKVGIKTKVKDFASKHKKKLIIGGAFVLSAVVGAIGGNALANKRHDNEADDYEMMYIPDDCGDDDSSEIPNDYGMKELEDFMADSSNEAD